MRPDIKIRPLPTLNYKMIISGRKVRLLITVRPALLKSNLRDKQGRVNSRLSHLHYIIFVTSRKKFLIQENIQYQENHIVDITGKVLLCMPLSFNINEKTVIVDDSERQPCEIWSRVMGYYRPIDQWNIGKRQEAIDRVNFKPPL